MDLFEPSPYLTFSIHLDGMRERQDSLVGRKRVFDNAVEAIPLAKKRGFRVTTNTTIYTGERLEEAGRLLDFINGPGVEGMTISPAFNYGNARKKKNFLERGETKTLFCDLLSEGRKRSWKFNHTSLFLGFLTGNQNYRCTPWGNPTMLRPPHIAGESASKGCMKRTSLYRRSNRRESAPGRMKRLSRP